MGAGSAAAATVGADAAGAAAAGVAGVAAALGAAAVEGTEGAARPAGAASGRTAPEGWRIHAAASAAITKPIVRFITTPRLPETTNAAKRRRFLDESADVNGTNRRRDLR